MSMAIAFVSPKGCEGPRALARMLVLAAASCLLMFSGCGSGAATTANTSQAVAGPRPHGGVVFALPGDSGFGEVVIEFEKGAKQAKGSVKSQVVVYFLSADRKSAMAALPNHVSAKLIPPDQEPVTVELKPQPRSKDAAGAGRFASQAGKYDYDELKIELTTTLNGQTFVQPITLH